MGILIASSDRSSIEAILPVASRLVTKGEDIIVLAEAQGWVRRRFEEVGIPSLAPENYEEVKFDAQALQKIIEEEKPDLVVIGLGGSDSLDFEMLRALSAGSGSIPVVAFLCSWLDEWRESGDCQCLYRDFVDISFVLDERSRDWLVEQNFPESRVSVTGNPAFDEGPKLRGERSRLRREVREALAISDDALLPLYALTVDLDREVQVSDGSRGFLEAFSFEEFLRLVGRSHLEQKHSFAGVVYQEPELGADRVRRFIQTLSPETRLMNTSEIDPRHLILAADFVVGTTTALLVQASLLQVPALSYLPKTTRPVPSTPNDLGIVKVVGKPGGLEEIFEIVAREPHRIRPLIPNRQFAPIPQATERIAALLLEYLKL